MNHIICKNGSNIPPGAYELRVVCPSCYPVIGLRFPLELYMKKSSIFNFRPSCYPVIGLCFPLELYMKKSSIFNFRSSVCVVL
jgi:hypothetical protein